jgi:hypothetical protein
VDEVASGGFPGVAAGLERGQDRIEIASRERRLVFANNVLLAQVSAWLEHRRADGMPTR